VVIDVDAKRRLRRARAFFAFMFGASICAFVLDGPRLWVKDIVMFINAMVWLALMLEYTYELNLLVLRDKGT